MGHVVEAICGLPGAAAFAESLALDADARLEVAKEVARNLPTHETLVLDAGSTTFLLSGLLSQSAQSPKRRVLTNNLAVSLCLAASQTECFQISGQVDDLHMCTVVSASILDNLFRSELAEPFTYVLTAAACRLDQSGIWVRARRPDQFTFKQTLVNRATSLVLAVETSKFVAPFDGTFEFPLAYRECRICTDHQLLQHSDLLSDLRHICDVAGYSLLIAGS